MTREAAWSRVMLRRATSEDALRFYVWRLETETQRFLPRFKESLSFDAHLSWFLHRVPRATWWVGWTATHDVMHAVDGTFRGRTQTPIGALRVDEGAVSVIVDQQYRGNGYGAQMLQMVHRVYANATGATGPVVLRASIHPLNTPSVRAFVRAGFSLETRGCDGAPFDTYVKEEKR